jgi:type IV fimbrial biogenesis protein FimT
MNWQYTELRGVKGATGEIFAPVSILSGFLQAIVSLRIYYRRWFISRPPCLLRQGARPKERVVKKRAANGFTLVELLVAVVIVGIAVSLALPNFSSLVQDTRLSGEANDMLAALNYARSEAVARNTRVTMCPSSDNGKSCANDSNSWKYGWVIFVDAGTVGTIDDGDAVLRVQGAIAGAKVGASSGLGNFVSYVSNGQTSASDGSQQAGTLTLCSVATKVKSRTIELKQGTGWVGITTDATSSTCPT